jgi:hypothetical protein
MHRMHLIGRDPILALAPALVATHEVDVQLLLAVDVLPLRVRHGLRRLLLETPGRVHSARLVMTNALGTRRCQSMGLRVWGVVVVIEAPQERGASRSNAVRRCEG